MNLPLILKAFGVKVPPETLAKIEALIPQIPDRINQAIMVINETIKQADARMAALEASNQALLSFVNRTHQQNEEIIRRMLVTEELKCDWSREAACPSSHAKGKAKPNGG